MSEYMERKGFSWSSEKNNYLPTIAHESEIIAISDLSEVTTEQVFSEPDGKVIVDSKFLPMLEMLYDNREKLGELLASNSNGIVPKYAVPGKAMTKSIYMSNLLSRLLSEYCSTKNLTQRDVVEAAIVEFLKKNGFDLEIEKLLSKK
jgi:hypothetical protein